MRPRDDAGFARRGRWAEGSIALALAAAFAVFAFAPAWASLNTDFVNYYLGARLLREGADLSSIHDLVWFQRQKDHAGIEPRIVSFFSLTAISALPMAPLASLSPLQAKRVWLIASAVLFIASGFILNRITGLGPVRLAVLGLLLVRPLQSHFLYGQVHVLVLLFLALSLLFERNGWRWGAGAALAAASVLKIYPVLFAAYYLRKRQWRVVAGMAAGLAVFGGLSVALFGAAESRTYLEEIVPRLLAGDNIDPYNSGWGSFSALFHRWFVFEPELNPLPLANAPLAAGVLTKALQAVAVGLVLWRMDAGAASPEIEKIEYSAFVAALLLLSTSPGPYHFVVLLIPGALVTEVLIRRGARRILALFLVVYAGAALPFPPGLSILRLAFASLLFAGLLLALRRVSRPQAPDKRMAAIAACVAALAFVLPSAAGRLEFAGAAPVPPPVRIALEPGSMMKAFPSVSDRGAVFTVLKSPYYTVGFLEGGAQTVVAAESDLFHAVWLPGTGSVLAERAGRSSSIVRIDPAMRTSGGSFPVVVPDAQQPTLSADGKLLGFIRADRGRGSLWGGELEAIQRDAASAAEWVGGGYDVLEASIGPGSVVFAARRSGAPSLYRLDFASGRIEPIALGGPARFPALSPDGSQLAYSRLEGGSWRLWLQSLRSGAPRRVTAGACNAIAPAWSPDSRELVYATDCARGAAMTGLARISVDR